MKMLSVIAMLLLVQACTSRPTQPVEGQNGGSGRNPKPAADLEERPSVPVVFDEQQLKHAYSFDTSNMRYKFSYLSTQTEGDLKFENGKARLDFKNLQEGVKGDLSLTLLEGAVEKLRGERKDLILNKGQNKIELLMKPLQAGTGTTDLLVSVELEQPASGGSNPPSNPPPTPPTGGGTPPGNPPNPPPTGGGDPTATSFARDIRPIFEAHCIECHHAGAQKPDLTSRAASEAGFARIIERIEGSDRPMPPAPRDKVSAGELDKLRSWKTQGFRP